MTTLPLRPPRHPAALSDKLSASYVGTGRLTCSLAVVLLAQANSTSRLEAQLCQYCAGCFSMCIIGHLTYAHFDLDVWLRQGHIKKSCQVLHDNISLSKDAHSGQRVDRGVLKVDHDNAY